MPVSRSPYFLVISLCMLALVFAGFAPTLYLRPFFDRPDQVTGTALPVHLVFHGLSMSSWYLIFALQAWLVKSGRTPVHRQLGKLGAISAVCVIVSGFIVLALALPRRADIGIQLPEEALHEARDVITSQTINLIIFGVLVALAIYYRTKSDIHKRLMVIASIMVIGAALSTNRMFGEAMQNLLPLPFGLLVNLLLAGSMVVFDGMKHRHMLKITLPAALYIMSRAWWIPILADSGVGRAWCNWLGDVPL